MKNTMRLKPLSALNVEIFARRTNWSVVDSLYPCGPVFLSVSFTLPAIRTVLIELPHKLLGALFENRTHSFVSLLSVAFFQSFHFWHKIHRKKAHEKWKMIFSLRWKWILNALNEHKWVSGMKVAVLLVRHCTHCYQAWTKLQLLFPRHFRRRREQQQK